MKKYLGILAFIFLITACGSPAPAAIFVPSSTTTAAVLKSSIYAANTDANCVGKTITVNAPITLTANLTLATDRAWRFDKGAVITTTGYTLNANGASVDIGDYQVFTGSGAVTGLKDRKPEWWGAKADGITDNAEALTKCMNAGPGTIHLNTGIYLLSTIQEEVYYLLKSKSDVSVIGEGPGSVLKAADGIRTTSTGIAILYNHTETISDVTYRDFTIDYNGQNNLFVTGYGVNATINRTGGQAGGSNITISNVTFKNSAGHHFLWFSGGYSSVTIVDSFFFESGQSISGNQSTDHSSIYANSDGLVISNNQFLNTTQDNIGTAIELHGNRISCTGNTIARYGHGANIAGDVADASGIVFSNNNLESVRNGVVVWTFDTYTVDDLIISGNRISILDTEEGGVYSPGAGIQYTGAYDTSTSTSANWNISKNVITPANVYTTAFAWAITGMNLNPVTGLTITGNTITGMKAEAIRIAEKTGKFHSGLVIADNSIVSCGYTTSANRNNGMSILSLDSYKTSNVILRGNTILAGHYGSASDMAYGISFTSQLFDNVTVADNFISGATTFDIYTPSDQTTDVFEIRHIAKVTGNPLGKIRASVGGYWYDSVAKRKYHAHVVGSAGTTAVWRSIEYLSAAPTTGQHYQGDRWINTASVAGQPKGGYCTAAGTPGTWVSEGNL